MARYQAEHKRETRRRILEAADDLIKAQGAEAASVSEVMQRAGLTVGGFYAHFPSKEALAQEALLFGLTRSVDRMLASLDGIADPKARVRALISQYLGQAEDPDLTHACPMTLLLPELARADRDTRNAFGGAYGRVARPDRRALSRDRRHDPPPGRALRVHELRRRGRGRPRRRLARSPSPASWPRPSGCSFARSVSCEIIVPTASGRTAFAEWTIPMLDRALQAELAAILPPAALLLTPEETKPYECDGLTLFRAQPAAVVLPENEAQVVAVLKACHAARVPVVARGAGTSLSGGALPDPSGVVLSLAKLKRILADRSGRAHRGRAARRAQPRDLRGGGAVRPLLRARSFVADRVLHRRQRRGERGRRALPQVRPHGAQRAPRARRADHRRHRRVRRRVARQPGLRSPGARQRQRGPARGHHRDHGQAPAQAAARAGRACRVRRRRESGRGGRRDHRRGHHPRRPRDDGPACHARGRAVRARELPARRRGGAARRIGRHQRGSRGRDGGHPAHPRWSRARAKCACRATRRSASCSGPGRKAAFPAVGRISPDYYCIDGTIPRKALPRVLRAIAEWSKEFGLRVRERLPRGRRQPASADPVRRQPRRRDRQDDRVRRSHPRAVHRSRRHGDGRARRRRREAQYDVRAVRRRRSSRASTASRKRSTRIACSIRARRCRRCTAAPRWAACTCTAATCRIPICPVSRNCTP